MAEENNEKLLSDMTDEEILAFVNKYNELEQQDIFDPANLYDLPEEDIVNLAVGMDYLTNAGLVDCNEVFPTLYKKVKDELNMRLGEAPLLDNANPNALEDSIDVVGGSPDIESATTDVVPQDYTELPGDTN